MSDVQQKALQAEHELELTKAAHDRVRIEHLDKAVALARKGDRDGALTELLIVAAMEDIRAKVRGHIDTATIETKVAEARSPAKQSN